MLKHRSVTVIEADQGEAVRCGAAQTGKIFEADGAIVAVDELHVSGEHRWWNRDAKIGGVRCLDRRAVMIKQNADRASVGANHQWCRPA